MKSIAWIVCMSFVFLLLGLLGCAAPSLQSQRTAFGTMGLEARQTAGPPARVVLVTVAGLVPADYLNPWGDAVGEGDPVRMPNLARLAREGATGLSAFPPSPGSSVASHATLATGRSPGSHGVVADASLSEDGTRAVPFFDNRRLQGTTLWDAALTRGVLALGWPTTAGARIELLVPDGEVQGGGGWLALRRSQSSPALMTELDALAKADLRRSGGGSERAISSWPSPKEKDAAFIETACRVASSPRDPGLWLIRLDETAAAQRDFGSGSVEVAEALARIDQGLGRLIACLEEAGKLTDTAVFVSGDAAYAPVHTLVSPNTVLVRTGLIGRDPRSATGVRSWLSMAWSHGQSAYIYSRDAESAVKARKELTSEAARVGGFRVVTAGELARTGADPQAWFGLVAAPGFAMGNSLTGPLLQPSPTRGVAGRLRFIDRESTSGDEIVDSDENAVGFVAWGRGIRNQVRLPIVEMVDIAPTIAALLGLRLGDDVEGKPILGILRAAVPPPPPGPKRLGGDDRRPIGDNGNVNDAIEELRRRRD